MKYAAVVSLMRCGGVQAAIAPTASPRWASALVSSGTDAVPGDAARGHGDRARNFFDGLDPRVLHGAARAGHAAAFA